MHQGRRHGEPLPPPDQSSARFVAMIVRQTVHLTSVSMIVR
jgi:hypothetical protein